jgi:tetratricopeptide (TPR) repeat protein
MQGIPLVEAIVSLEDSDPREAELFAAAVVFRFAKSALRGYRPLKADRIRAFTLIRRIADFDIQQLLSNVLLAIDAIYDLEVFSIAIDPVLKHLIIYGTSLHTRREYDLAIHAFEMVTSALVCEPDLRVQALLQRGFACRLANRLDEALFCYAEVERHAKRSDFEVMRIEGVLGRARVIGMLGDIPESGRLIDSVIPDAERAGSPALLEKVYIDRATTAGLQKQYVKSIHFSYVALEGMTNDNRRIRTKANIAVCLRELSFHDEAVELCEQLDIRSAESDVRASVISTRYHLAIDAHDWKTTKALRKRLRRIAIVPDEVLSYYELAGREFAERRKFGVARRLLVRMVCVAEEAKLAERVIWAEKAIRDVDAGRVPVRYTFMPQRTTSEEESAVKAMFSTITAPDESHATIR